MLKFKSIITGEVKRISNNLTDVEALQKENVTIKKQNELLNARVDELDGVVFELMLASSGGM